MMFQTQMMKIKTLQIQLVKWPSMLMIQMKILNIKLLKRKVKRKTIKLSNWIHNLIQVLEKKNKDLKNKTKINHQLLQLMLMISKKNTEKFQISLNKMQKTKQLNSKSKIKDPKIGNITKEMVREMTRVYKKETDNLQDKKKLIQESCLESMVLLILYGEKE